MMRSKQRGFTLLEVLIVVAIIIIIAGIALPRFLGVSEQGKKARVKGDLRVLQTAIESYILNTNTLPAGSDLPNGNPQIISDFTNDFKDPFSTVSGGAVYKLATNSNANGKKYYVWYSVGANGGATLTISNVGVVTGHEGDDVFVSNGNPGSSG
ncbi:MAG: type II secretion system protein [Candidatus Omnitrophica bacterium]|nr:type II secretion system protein [Candidatus Omnitrophota bacterium]